MMVCIHFIGFQSVLSFSKDCFTREETERSRNLEWAAQVSRGAESSSEVTSTRSAEVISQAESSVAAGKCVADAITLVEETDDESSDGIDTSAPVGRRLGGATKDDRHENRKMVNWVNN